MRDRIHDNISTRDRNHGTHNQTLLEPPDRSDIVARRQDFVLDPASAGIWDNDEIVFSGRLGGAVDIPNHFNAPGTHGGHHLRIFMSNVGADGTL